MNRPKLPTAATALAAAGLLVAATGCGEPSDALEIEDRSENALEAMEESPHFTEVNIEIDEMPDDGGFGTHLQEGDFTAVVEPDADVEEAGEVLAEVAQEYELTPNLEVPAGSTYLWVDNHHSDTLSSLPPEGWADLLALSAETSAAEVSMFQDEDDGSVRITLRDQAEIYTRILGELEQWQEHEAPAGVDQFEGAVYAGTMERPKEVHDLRPSMHWRGDVTASGPLNDPETDLGVATELLQLAQESPDFEEVTEFTMDLSGSPQVVLAFLDDRVQNSNEDPIPEDLYPAAEAYADQVRGILGEGIEVEVHFHNSYEDSPTLYPPEEIDAE